MVPTGFGQTCEPVTAVERLGGFMPPTVIFQIKEVGNNQLLRIKIGALST